MALPTPPDGLVTSIDEVAVLLGKEPSDLTDGQRLRIEASIRDAQADVAAQLNRDSLFAVEDTRSGLYPDQRYPLTSWQAWAGIWDDWITVKTFVGDGFGGYEVTVDLGVNGRDIQAIRSYVTRMAKEDVQSDPTATGLVSRTVQSVSAEGQSVSYATQQRATSGRYSGAGSSQDGDPAFKGLMRYRRVVIGTPTVAAPTVWPYEDTYYGSR